MVPTDRDLGEQALSKLAEAGISSQVDEVEKLNVDIKTDPIKLVQGELETVEITAEGLVVQQELRMQAISVQTNGLAINPLSVVLGKIELTRPTDATAQVVLTEVDINRAFNSEYIQQKLQNLDIVVNGQSVTIDTQQVEFRLPGQGQFFIEATVVLKQVGEVKQLAFSTTPRVSPDNQQIFLENIEYEEGKGFSAELTEALIERTRELLNLSNFELEGMRLQLRELQVQTGQLVLLGDATIEQFPLAES